ncbi:hypothetical protein BB559_004721 [Furculomyces boomerangus]|uniref:Uncharacterized protein n=3 Tax=Harpellales TaxID=61421 RepID=A0A2T9YD53_9FUNG|nr:hypothetical protein BB559_004721 [Furculomyces boomerangus]
MMSKSGKKNTVKSVEAAPSNPEIMHNRYDSLYKVGSAAFVAISVSFALGYYVLREIKKHKETLISRDLSKGYMLMKAVLKQVNKEISEIEQVGLQQIRMELDQVNESKIELDVLESMQNMDSFNDLGRNDEILKLVELIKTSSKSLELKVGDLQEQLWKLMEKADGVVPSQLVSQVEEKYKDHIEKHSDIYQRANLMGTKIRDQRKKTILKAEKVDDAINSVRIQVNKL